MRSWSLGAKQTFSFWPYLLALCFLFTSVSYFYVFESDPSPLSLISLLPYEFLLLFAYYLGRLSSLSSSLSYFLSDFWLIWRIFSLSSLKLIEANDCDSFSLHFIICVACEWIVVCTLRDLNDYFTVCFITSALIIRYGQIIIVKPLRNAPSA